MANKMKIKKGDKVVVISGADKTKSGKVLEVYPDTDRVLVEGVNVASKHKKARKVNEQSGIIHKESPIHVSNVMLYDDAAKAPTRVKMEVKGGKKVRVSKKSGAELD